MASASCGRACRGPTAGTPPVWLGVGGRGVGAGMWGADRRHAAGVARRVEAALGEAADRPVIAAALLHDVGKIASGLGTYGRVVATLAGAAGGRDTAHAWSAKRGFT